MDYTEGASGYARPVRRCVHPTTVHTDDEERQVSQDGAAVRPLRADAARNRAKILDAATAAFDEHGTDASLEDIARTAGVGVGTLYRHFPTRLDLIEAV